MPSTRATVNEIACVAGRRRFEVLHAMTMTMTMLYLESYTVLCIVVSYKKIRRPS